MIYKSKFFITIVIAVLIFSCNQSSIKQEKAKAAISNKQTIAVAKSYLPIINDSINKKISSIRKPSCCTGSAPSRFSYKTKPVK
jgi:hypothetical protein